jgi:hypothetical protein
MPNTTPVLVLYIVIRALKLAKDKSEGHYVKAYKLTLQCNHQNQADKPRNEGKWGWLRGYFLLPPVYSGRAVQITDTPLPPSTQVIVPYQDHSGLPNNILSDAAVNGQYLTFQLHQIVTAV